MSLELWLWNKKFSMNDSCPLLNILSWKSMGNNDDNSLPELEQTIQLPWAFLVLSWNGQHKNMLCTSYDFCEDQVR